MKKIRFTEEENQFIEMCFVETLFHFIKDPLKRDSIDDIREAVNYRNYHIGQIGTENHKLMHSIFDKMEYCKDGKTTKTEEYQRQLQFEKEKAEHWGIVREEKIKALRDVIVECKQMIKDFTDFETDYDKMVQEEAEKVKAKFQVDMKEKKEIMQKVVIQKTEDQKEICDMTVKELKDFAKRKGIKGATHLPNKAALRAFVEANV